MTVSSKEENSEDFHLDFVQQFGLCMASTLFNLFVSLVDSVLFMSLTALWLTVTERT
jgi:hypothetical protein